MSLEVIFTSIAISSFVFFINWFFKKYLKAQNTDNASLTNPNSNIAQQLPTSLGTSTSDLIPTNKEFSTTENIKLTTNSFNSKKITWKWEPLRPTESSHKLILTNLTNERISNISLVAPPNYARAWDIYIPENYIDSGKSIDIYLSPIRKQLCEIWANSNLEEINFSLTYTTLKHNTENLVVTYFTDQIASHLRIAVEMAKKRFDKQNLQKVSTTDDSRDN